MQSSLLEFVNHRGKLPLKQTDFLRTTCDTSFSDITNTFFSGPTCGPSSSECPPSFISAHLENSESVDTDETDESSDFMIHTIMDLDGPEALSSMICGLPELETERLKIVAAFWKAHKELSVAFTTIFIANSILARVVRLRFCGNRFSPLAGSKTLLETDKDWLWVCGLLAMRIATKMEERHDVACRVLNFSDNAVLHIFQPIRNFLTASKNRKMLLEFEKQVEGCIHSDLSQGSIPTACEVVLDIGVSLGVLPESDDSNGRAFKHLVRYLTALSCFNDASARHMENPFYFVSSRAQVRTIIELGLRIWAKQNSEWSDKLAAAVEVLNGLLGSHDDDEVGMLSKSLSYSVRHPSKLVRLSLSGLDSKSRLSYFGDWQLSNWR